MSDMTDERAAEVLAAHNEWRRFNGDPFDPGAPEMGDPAEIGRAIAHAVSRLRSQPPAEAQGGGEALEAELRHTVAKLAAHVRPTCGELWAEAERLLNRAAPPSAPVGVEGLVAKWRDKSRRLRQYHDCDALSDELEGCAQELEAALAQQPAAVDDAERMAEILREQKGRAGYERPYPDTGKTHRDYLAGQQGGSDDR